MAAKLKRRSLALSTEATQEQVHSRKLIVPPEVVWQRYWVQISLLLAMLVAHSPALVSGFVWDDFHFIETWLPRFTSVKDIFLPPPNIPHWPYHYYRPLGILSLKVENLLFGNQIPIGYHASNLILHGIACLLVYQLLKRVFSNNNESIAAIAGAMIFAVHPIHVESVNWIAGRSDILAVISTLITLLLSLRYLQSKQFHWAFWATISLFMGLLFKELAVCAIPLYCVLAGLLRFEQPDLSSLLSRVRCSIPLLFCQSIALIAYMMARHYVGAPSTGSNSIADQPFGQFGTVVQAGGYYFGQMFLFQPQVVQAPTRFLPSLAISIVIVALALVAPIVIGRTGRDVKPLWMSILWFALSLAPSLAVIVRQTDSAFLSERYLYLPSIGFAMGSGWAVMVMLQLVKPNTMARRLLYSLLAVAGIAMSAKTVVYGSNWIDNDAMWTRVLRIVPHHWNAYVVLSESSERKKNYEQMIDYSWKAAEVAETKREKAALYARIAIIGREMPVPIDRVKAATLATELDPKLPDGWLELGIIEFERENLSLAEKCFHKAVECDENCSEAYVNLAKLADDENVATSCLMKAIETNPWNKMAFNNLGVLHAKHGRLDLAKACMRKAIDLDPQFEMAINNLRAIQ